MVDSNSIRRLATFRLSAVLLSFSGFSSAAIAGDVSNYSYDALGRLVQVSRTSTVFPSTTSAYTYDPAGNRTNVTVTGAAASDRQTGQGATAPCAGGAVCRYFMPPIAGFAPIRY